MHSQGTDIGVCGQCEAVHCSELDNPLNVDSHCLGLGSKGRCTIYADYAAAQGRSGIYHKADTMAPSCYHFDLDRWDVVSILNDALSHFAGL